MVRRSKMWSIAREEIALHFRQPAYYYSLAITLVLFVAAAALPRLQTTAESIPLDSIQNESIFSETDTLESTIGYIDNGNIIQQLTDEESELFLRFPDETAAQQAVEEEKIESYYVIAADYLETGKVQQFSPNPQLIEETDSAVQEILRRNVLIPINQDGLSERLATPLTIEWENETPTAFSFIPADLDRELLGTAAVVAGIFAYMLNAGGFLLLGALQRETNSRVLELLLTSASPEEFISGKLIGLTALAFIQLSISIVAGWFVYQIDQVGTGLPAAFVAVAIPYLVLGYLVYGSVMVSVAAVLPNLGESMQLQFIFRLLYLSPVVGAIFILPNPDSLTSIVLTMIPITSPLLMPFRVLLTNVPLWEVLTSLAILLAWAGLLFVFSARLFRANAMLTGRSPSLKTLARAIMYK